MKKSDKFKLSKFSQELVVKHFVRKNGRFVNFEEFTFSTFDALKTLKEFVKTIGNDDEYYAEVRFIVIPKKD